MTASPWIPVVFNSLVIFLIFGLCADNILAQEGTSLTEIQTETSLNAESENELPANRVLPVDAEHKSKITFTQQSLEPICVHNLRENLVKFLKRLKRSGVRQARQDDGDDGDDGDGEGGGGLLAGIGGGNGALAAFQQLPSFLPQFVTTLTQISGAVNQGLNGTDTPNLPSFLVKQGQQLIQALTASQGISAPAPRPAPVQHRVPVPGGVVPQRQPQVRPPSLGYDQYPPGADPEDYIDEVVKQPLQPTVRPGGLDFGGPRPSSYDPYPGNPYPGNPYLGNVGLRTTQAPQITNVETVNGLPPKTSLWQIYKSFRNRSPVNGSLSEFQLQHPDAFSNELLQSISSSIANIRGQAPNVAVAPTAKPPSEIFNQVRPTAHQPQQASIFNNHNRPTLSVYKPGSAISGVGLDLSNLASMNKVVSQSQSNHHTNQQEEQSQEEVYLPSSIQQELELESIASLGISKPQPVGSGGTAGTGGKPAYNIKNSLATTGSLSQLHAQQTQGTNNKFKPQFVKPPTTSSHLAHQTVSYVPVVSSLHENEKDHLKIVGPQANGQDTFNGFNNHSPYKPVKGVLLDAPRLTPSPLLALKPPSKLQISQTTHVQAATQYPEFSIQSSNALPGSGPTKLLPPGVKDPPIDPNPPREPVVNAQITSNYHQYHPQYSPQVSGALPPSVIPPNNNLFPQSEAISSSLATSTERSQYEVQPDQSEDIPAPETNKHTFSLGSSLTNLAQASHPLESQNAPGSNSVGNSGSGQNTASQTPNESSKLLLYLLTNFPNLVANPKPQISNESPNGLTGESEASINDIKTGAPQVQEDILTSNYAPSPAPSETLAKYPQVQNKLVAPQAPNSPSSLLPLPAETPRPETQSNLVAPQAALASLLLPYPVETPRPQVQNNQVASLLPNFASLLQHPGINPPSVTQPPPPIVTTDKQLEAIFPASWGNYGVAPAAIDSHPQDQQQYLQHSPPFGGLVQGPSSISTGTGNRNDTKINVEPTTTTRSISSIHTIGNYLAPFEFPSAPVHSNPVEVSGNKVAQTMESSYESTEEPPATIISVVTSVSVSGSDSTEKSHPKPLASQPAFPSLSNLYGNAIPLPYPEHHQEEFVAPITTSTTSTSTTRPFVSLANLPYPSYQHFDGIPTSIDGHGLPGTSSFVPPLPPPLSKPVGGSSHRQRPVQIGGHRPLTPSSFPSASPGLQAPSFGASPSGQMDPSQASETKQPSPGSFSAIATMSKLPFLQGQFFRPSNLIPSYDQREPEVVKPISESSLSLPSASNEIIIATEKGLPSVIPDDNSIEQEIPNFPPGKPAYWMNMYYPNGIPVLTRVTQVRSTTLPPSTTPRKRRRKTTTWAPPTTTPEVEYYEDEDPSKPKRKKNVVDFELANE